MKELISGLTICVLLSGCVSSNQTNSVSQIHTQQQTEQEKSALSQSIQSQNQSDIEKVIVQRGHDIINLAEVSPERGLIANAEDFYRFAYRREGENLGIKNEKELKFLQESQEEGSSQNDYTYIRLVQTPYIPEIGENAHPRKDIVIYLDARYPDDAFVGEQNPKKLEEWTIYQVKGYGNWLKKDIDLYLSLYKGL
ncbi:hypothetical protein [Brevibacillus borstelensis]|uniref:hypothetical protein n=1 Tax=Brevibacillus borstelensis TaxID=45462 RepID=UPI0030C34B70